LTETDGVGALFGNVVNAKESLLNQLAIQVVANLDGNTMIVRPRIHLEGLGQVGEILLPDPFEVGGNGTSQPRDTQFSHAPRQVWARSVL
jgi:hypothetical protein